MSKLQLPSVTLCIIDCLNAEKAIKVLEHCKSMCDFGAVKFLTSIPTDYEHAVRIKPLNSLIAYSVFVATKLHEYIDTQFLLIIQRDGWILNPQSFNPEWLEKYDYIGPIFMQYDKCGSGGFSLRSKKIMEGISKELPEWNWSQKQAEEIQSQMGYYEDGFCSLVDWNGKYKIASLEDAADFAQGGNRNPKYFREYPFGWHRTFQDIDFKTGRVDSSDTTKDIHVSYDAEINDL